MKSLVKAVFPTAILDQARNHRRFTEWRKLARKADRHPAPGKGRRGRILILPSDLESITGALGDDAMISATVAMCRKADPDVSVDMFCRESAASIVRDLGYTPIRVPPVPTMCRDLAALFKGAPYDGFFILGADIMDGYYYWEGVSTLIVAADLAARNGVPTTILGCSFNDRPAPELVPYYTQMSREVSLNMRDVISLERIEAFAPVKTRLVADCAFTLPRGTAPVEAVAWIEAQRAAGRTVIGVNAHPMLIKNATEAEVERITASVTAALVQNSGGREVAWLMLPHDYRGRDGDAVCLRPIYERLSEAGGIETHFLEGTHRAADLKALCGHLDGVVTGRMHLAIASLGMGVPVLSLTYQEKFEGLYRHFNLPESLLLPPAVFGEGSALSEGLDAFVAALPALSEIVRGHGPAVQALAWSNYDTYFHAAEIWAPALSDAP